MSHLQPKSGVNLPQGNEYLNDIKFNAMGANFYLRSMKASDYDTVRHLLPSVSRCSLIHSVEEVEKMLCLPTYFAFCLFHKKGTNEEVKSARAVTENIEPTSDDNLCGFCEVYLMPHLGRSADARLERVVIVEEMRGKGLASIMCEDVIRFCRETLKISRMDLTVEKPDARHIYETKLGFKEVNTKLLRREWAD